MFSSMSTAPPASAIASSRVLDIAAGSHPGRERDENEDAFGLFPGSRLFVVADGMGGRAGGAVAARIAVDEVERFFREQHASPRSPWPFPLDRSLSLGSNLLRVGMQVANQKIRDAASSRPEYHRMGATVAALAVGETQVVVAHLGDVRVYRLRSGVIDAAHPRPLGGRGGPGRPAGHQRHRAGRDRSPPRGDTRPGEPGGGRALGQHPRARARRSLPALFRRTVGFGSRFDACPGSWSMRLTWTRRRSCSSMAANAAGGPDNITAALVRIA